MTFDEWVKYKRAKTDRYIGGEVPTDTSAMIFARAAWDAAIDSAWSAANQPGNDECGMLAAILALCTEPHPDR